MKEKFGETIIGKMIDANDAHGFSLVCACGCEYDAKTLKVKKHGKQPCCHD